MNMIWGGCRWSESEPLIEIIRIIGDTGHITLWIMIPWTIGSKKNGLHWRRRKISVGLNTVRFCPFRAKVENIVVKSPLDLKTTFSGCSSFAQFVRTQCRLRRLHHYYPTYVTSTMVDQWTSSTSQIFTVCIRKSGSSSPKQNFKDACDSMAYSPLIHHSYFLWY